MRILLHALRAIVVVGLFAAPCVPRPLPQSTARAVALAIEPHELLALHREAGAEVLTIEPSDESGPQGLRGRRAALRARRAGHPRMAELAGAASARG